MKNLLFVSFLFIALSSLAQTKLTIHSADKEKCVRLGSNGFIDRGGFFEAFYASSNQDTVRSFLQFDLSSIPQGSRINWAKLSLFYYIAFQDGLNSSKLRRITSPWDPNTVTWRTQQALLSEVRSAWQTAQVIMKIIRI